MVETQPTEVVDLGSPFKHDRSPVKKEKMPKFPKRSSQVDRKATADNNKKASDVATSNPSSPKKRKRIVMLDSSSDSGSDALGSGDISDSDESLVQKDVMGGTSVGLESRGGPGSSTITGPVVVASSTLGAEVGSSV